ncbi:sensor domain-containing diguanylate cyclase/phosphohydrolase [Clostridium beijerinckii]|nr:HD domain-containing phosphohydrolase [Clostridium beijerinckii]MZK49570.1 diguanylate cyclase [Clostridium beijerinckii]MZK58295.1 diguanylate cyclase [Clostridium beijerinckii]MZK68153.1 diguanylate cyclase [Clostridium beijerinckii]MZK73238.1 diguanylate cyclase [Clostridium beijerinckii]MZK83224.1 diguanylate cyclase [Clostridium beijerinckii]
MEYKLFKLLADNLPQPIWIKDLELRFIYVNKEYKAIYKDINEEFIGKNDAEIFDGAVREECIEYCNKVINSLKPLTEEGYLDGKRRKVTIVPLIDEGKIFAVAGIYANLDIIKEKDKIIEEQENILKVVMDTLPGRVFFKDKEGRYVYVNKQFDEFYNKDGIGEVVGKTNIDIHPTEELAAKYSREDNEVIKNKRSIKAETILYSEDGEEIYTEAVKVPVIDKSGDVAGVVGLVLDVTEKKEAEKKLRKLSFTDILTGLYNRTYFEEKVKEFQSEEYLPVGVIMGDANGLKLVNDTLGHDQGDELLRLIAQALKDVCGEKQLIFRTGGDEFVILSKNTTEQECEIIIKNIFDRCKMYKHDLINVSISLGASVADSLNKSIYEALKEADDKVYRQKLLQKTSLNSSIMYSLQMGLEAKSLETEEHTDRVLANSIAIGEKLSLPMSVMDELTIVAKLHDIGKIGINEEILLKKGELTEDEFEVVKTHTEKGYRIVKASNQLDNVAKGVLAHHERWDGNGYPLKLEGEKIPLVSRIVSVADSYDAMTNNGIYKRCLNKEEAIEELKRCSGKQFDPIIVKAFIEYLEEIEE